MKISTKRGVSDGVKTLELADLQGGRRNELVRKAGRRKVRTPKMIGRKSRPETPLLRWKFEESEVKEEDEAVMVESDERYVLQAVKKDDSMVSARKLAAGLWKLKPDSDVVAGEERVVSKGGADSLGFRIKCGDGHGGLTDFRWECEQNFKSPEVRHVRHSPQDGSGPKNGYTSRVDTPFQISNYEMEGATKWDPLFPKTSQDASELYGYMKPRERQVSAAALVSSLESKLEKAQARIQELEHEQKSSRRKLESFLKKINEEKAAWRRREHEKVRVILDDVKSDLNREKKCHQRVEIVNSKLVDELAGAKLLVKRYMHDFEKERKARELIEEVCEELAKEILNDKEYVEALKRECSKIQDDAEDERKLLQMAEVWREERVQMKLVDIKVAVEEKYSQMNMLVAGIEHFLESRNANLDSREMREAEMLHRAAASLNVQDVRDFSYVPPKSDDIFAVFENLNMAEMSEKDIKTCVNSPAASHISKAHAPSHQVESDRRNNIQRPSIEFVGKNGDMEGEGSGWETVSQLEDQGSNYSSDCSVRSVGRRTSNVSGNVTEWEDKGGQVPKITEIIEVSPGRQSKKGSTISRIWKQHPNNEDSNIKRISVEGVTDRLSDGRQSNGSIHSVDQGSVKGVNSPSYLMGWSSPDSRNPNYHKGMKGCIEWPLGAVKNDLKAKLMAARSESEKVQLRQLLRQKY